VLTRRQLLRAAVASVSAALAGAAGLLGRSRRGREAQARVTVPAPAADGVRFHGEVILVRAGGELRAFSSRCPHLGCRIDREEGGRLVCPCHGSKFDRAGRQLEGPATAGLRELRLSAGDAGSAVDVELG
jgi:Rieske Fe-S protein